MKTIKNTKGKQIEKAVIKSFFSILIIAALGITVNGQNFWASAEDNLEETQKSKMSEVAGYYNVGYSTGEVTKFSHIESEKSLKLEDWMISKNYFGTFVNVEAETEKALELESWMITESFFDIGSEFTTIEKENALELEAWMTDESYFVVPVLNITEEADENLEIENWMVNDNYFEVVSTGNNEKVEHATAKIADRF